MPILAAREFECILCRKQLTLLAQDLILPWTLICDACLEALLALEEEALSEYLAAAHQAGEPSQLQKSTAAPIPRHPFEREITAHIESMKTHWDDGSGSDARSRG